MRERLPWIALAAIVLLLVATTGTLAAYRSSSSNGGNNLTAAADWVAPNVTSAIAKKTTGYSAAYLKQAGTYHVYANVTDSGNPADGVGTVKANLAVAGSVVSTGQTAVSLTTTGGPWTVEGTSYAYRTSSALTADNPLSAGSKTWQTTATDLGARSRTQSFSLTADNTAPSASNVQTANGSTTAGRPEQGDSATFTFSEPMDPDSILTGWTGSSTTVVVRITNNTSCTGPANDRLTVWNAANTTQLALGCVNLGGTGYVTANRTFGGTTASTMSMSGSTVTVTLGTPSGATTTGAAGTMVWAPSTAAYDRAANAGTATNATESGAADAEF